MRKKIYMGGLPWELDRIGLLNYLKAILEGKDIVASYELPFISTPDAANNSALKVVDVFVASDRETGKSRGFGFITLEIDEDQSNLFETVIDLLKDKTMIGIRGPRSLIVNEAQESQNDASGSREAEYSA